MQVVFERSDNELAAGATTKEEDFTDINGYAVLAVGLATIGTTLPLWLINPFKLE